MPIQVVFAVVLSNIAEYVAGISSSSLQFSRKMAERPSFLFADFFLFARVSDAADNEYCQGSAAAICSGSTAKVSTI